MVVQLPLIEFNTAHKTSSDTGSHTVSHKDDKTKIGKIRYGKLKDGRHSHSRRQRDIRDTGDRSRHSACVENSE